MRSPETGRARAVLVLAAGATLALAFVLSWPGRAPEPRDDRAGPGAPGPWPETASAPPQAPVTPGAMIETHADTPPTFPARFEGRVRDALDAAIAETGRDVSDAKREALMTTLASVRRSSRWAQRLPAGNHALQAKHRERILAADRLFRETLGIGIGTFLARQSEPEEIIDLGAARQ